ncbi:MAG: amino acid racemase [Oscillospiraceae bacterium]|nr:amino acid racemase [Oscillospiraceae bacterium]
MKKIGLIGGTGPESTLMYYRELNLRADAMTDGREMPEIAVESVDFRKAWGYVTDGRYDLLSEYLCSKAMLLKQSGAEVIALTAVTMHAVYDRIVSETGIPLVSIPEAVCRYAQAQGIRKAGLLGTAFTMEMDFMKAPFEKAGIEIAVPDKAERALVAKRIFEELEVGIVKDSTRAELCGIIERMKSEDGIEAVILGCTELPLILGPDNTPVKCIDAVEVHLCRLLELSK